jgi:hypothetical protein
VPVLLSGGRDGDELCHFVLDAMRVEEALAQAARIRGERGVPL